MNILRYDDEGPPPVPWGDPETVVDYDGEADQWIGHCSEHVEILRVAGAVDDHNLVVVRLLQHDEYRHDGDGQMHWSAWLL